MSTSTKTYFTLCQAESTFTYILAHSDGREISVRADWQFPSIAFLMAWDGPCSHCRRGCRDETDGTVDCLAKTALDHILNAMAYLDRNIGRRVPDVNSVFDYIEEDGYATYDQ